MHSLIHKLLHKRGIETVNELSSEEKQTFDTWQKILSKEALTTEDIKVFCQSQIDIIENKWKDLNTENIKKAELIPYHTVYKTLVMAIESPKSARENLEIQLQQLLQ